MATTKLQSHGFDVVPLGIKAGQINGLNIVTNWPQQIPNLGVVTLYIGPARQPEHYDYIVNLKPQKVIFNPGTENPEFEKILSENNIAFEKACTLVLLSLNQYNTK
jgi:predicted CoA-binding protein